MDTSAEATPTTLSNQSCPRGDGCEYSSDALSVKTESSQRHVRQFGIKHHVLDRRDFFSSELARRAPRTRRAVVEITALGHSLPSVISRRRKAENSQDHGKRQHRLGAGDCTQDGCLRDAVGQPFAIETESRYPQKRQQEPDDRGQSPCLALHLVEPLQQLLAILPERFEADDRSRAAALP